MPGSRVIHFRTGRDGDGLSWELGRRATATLSSDLVARRDLARYYELIRRERPTFSLRDALLVAYALRNARDTLLQHGPRLIGALVASCDTLDASIAVDRVALARRIGSMSYAQIVALLDAVERLWSYMPSGASILDSTATHGPLAASGLLDPGEDAP